MTRNGATAQGAAKPPTQVAAPYEFLRASKIGASTPLHFASPNSRNATVQLSRDRDSIGRRPVAGPDTAIPVSRILGSRLVPAFQVAMFQSASAKYSAPPSRIDGRWLLCAKRVWTNDHQVATSLFQRKLPGPQSSRRLAGRRLNQSARPKCSYSRTNYSSTLRFLCRVTTEQELYDNTSHQIILPVSVSDPPQPRNGIERARLGHKNRNCPSGKSEAEHECLPAQHYWLSPSVTSSALFERVCARRHESY
eukprot:CAMPEP_0198365402 /NCGR_PEP_ID=MMETSP1450-20131203/154154_1 /TAXON_ID=753684 ORGANISM="Madagascaria erythrocladiodes, Strain CCMP3234" /NCGR_SAMPLE_ID=MMETSP1450 /ASSEMBLY_ACC=CAM_ASM_001115 /LENGTH=250 /DNA_ID=CAMNT_0044072853 /DNA_START=936 /DNA_END=1685 /DNA_ORIENTATION=-